MATLTIRNIPDEVKQALRERAARHGVSMEEEARRVLQDVARATMQTSLELGGNKTWYDEVREMVAAHGGGFDLDIPPRQDIAGERTKFWWLEDAE
jgi:plasmid stability protein